MSFVVLGDAHLWPVMWPRIPGMRGDSQEAVKEVLDYAVEADLPVVSSGDLLDQGERGGVASVLSFLRERIVELPQGFYYVVGNHDCSGKTAGDPNTPWMHSLPQGRAMHLEGRSIELPGGETVTGFDYRGDAQDAHEAFQAAAERGTDVLVMHQGIRSLLGHAGAYEFEDIDLIGYDGLVVCGHVHTAKAWTIENTTRVLSPGGLVPSDISEILADRLFPVVDGQTITFRPLKNVRPMRTMEALDAVGEHAVVSYLEDLQYDTSLPECLQRPYLRVITNPGPFYDKLVSLAQDKVFLETKITRIAETSVSETIEEISQDDDIERITRKHAPDERVYRAAVEIQKGSDPDEVLERHVQEILG